MKRAEEWFEQYLETHKNPLNQKIHFVCVPLIFWSVAALLSVTPTPALFTNVFMNWMIIILIPVLVFYARLGFRYFLEMFVISLITVCSVFILSAAGVAVAPLALTVFVIAWVGQFYGHKIEGKKPSFLTDLLFLLIGPLWICEKVLKNSRY